MKDAWSVRRVYKREETQFAHSKRLSENERTKIYGWGGCDPFKIVVISYKHYCPSFLPTPTYMLEQLTYYSNLLLLL